MEFEFRPGPIVSHIVLADEINRTSPKTQSALLESMEEASVTIDGNTLVIPKPFFVMATQNQIEYEGTYPLPEAQLDRFLLKIKMGYPTREQEIEVLRRLETGMSIEQLPTVLSIEQLRQLQQDVKEVYIEDSLKAYIVDLANHTRDNQYVYLGASPRASIALMKQRAYAFMQGRSFVTPDDIQYLVPFVFNHRLLLKPEARYDDVRAEEIVHSIIHTIDVPIKKN